MNRLILLFNCVIYRQIPVVILILFGTATLHAQTMDRFFFQTTVMDYDQNILANQQIGMRITLITSESKILYEEKQVIFTNTRGLASFYIGDGYDVSGSFRLLAPKIREEILYVRIQIDPEGGNDYKILQHNRMNALPLALHSSYVLEPSEKDSNFLQSPASTLSVNQLTRWNNAARERHYPGDMINGASVFYVDSTGESGLVMTPFNIAEGVSWMEAPSDISASGHLTDGKTNTREIVNQYGDQAPAAYVCDTLVYKDRDDWYLPSIDELGLIFSERYVLNRTLGEDSNEQTLGMDAGTYWSSTQIDANDAYVFDVLNSSSSMKNEQAFVRAVRRFSGMYDAHHYRWEYLGGPETELGNPVQIVNNENGDLILDVKGKRGTVFRQIPITELPAKVTFKLNTIYGPDAGTKPQELHGTGAFRIFVGGPHKGEDFIPMSEGNLGTFEGVQFRIHPHIDQCPIRRLSDEGTHFEAHTSTSIWMRYITKVKRVDDNGNPITGLVADECQRRGNQCGWERVGLFENGFGLENVEETEVTLIISEEEISMEANGRKFTVDMENLRNDDDVDGELFRFDRITNFSITQTNISRRYETVIINDLRAIPIK